MSIGQAADRQREKSRRLMRMTFNIHVPAWVLSEAFSQLPRDTMLVRCGFDDLHYGRSTMILWSRQFDPCPQQCALPDLMIEVTRQEDGSETVRVVRTNENNEWVPCQFD